MVESPGSVDAVLRLIWSFWVAAKVLEVGRTALAAAFILADEVTAGLAAIARRRRTVAHAAVIPLAIAVVVHAVADLRAWRPWTASPPKAIPAVLHRTFTCAGSACGGAESVVYAPHTVVITTVTDLVSCGHAPATVTKAI